MNSNPIHIAFCVNDKYADYIRVTIISILENNKNNDIIIHVLSDYISEKRKKALETLINLYSNARLKIYIVDDHILRGLKDTWTIYTWYRVLLPEILPNDIKRILYLDTDVIVSTDISDMFNLEMDNKAIAGTIDFQTKDDTTYLRCGYNKNKQYICAGILLMNLEYWRKNSIAEQIIKWGRDNNDKIKFPDQDAINFICQDSKIILPLRYDIVDGFFYDNYFYNNYRTELKDCIENPAIIHYAGQAPWIVELGKHTLQFEWDEYNKMLENPIKKTYKTKGLNQIKVRVYNLLHPNVLKPKLTIEEIRAKLSKM